MHHYAHQLLGSLTLVEKPGEYALEPHFALWRLTCTLVLTGWIRLQSRLVGQWLAIHGRCLANGCRAAYFVGLGQLLDWDSCVCVCFPLTLSHRGCENAQPLERLA